MSNKQNRVLVKGSERTAPAPRRVGEADPNSTIDVTVRVRRKAGAPDLKASVGTAPGERKILTRAQYAAEHSADSQDMNKVKEFAAQHKLTVIEADDVKRTIKLRGTIANLKSAFGTDLALFQHPDGGTFRGRTGPLTVPDELGNIVEGVFGLDNRPQATPHFRLHKKHAAAAAAVSYTPVQVAGLYDFPTSSGGTLPGSGQTVGILELGGGYQSTDLQNYFKSLGITPPNVVSVSVDGGDNSPTGDSSGPDGEVMLDIEVVGAIAPGANIAVYFAPNTDQGFIDAVLDAAHDSTNDPSVLSISWGSAEVNWTQQAMTALDDALQTAAALGVSVFAATGDNGSADGVSDGKAHVDFPASSPNITACGGTTLESKTGSITSETAWSDGGGGVSDVFPLPSYQSTITIKSVNDGGTRRTIPDVAGDADPNTGYQILVDGSNQTIGGTSAVAPLWAGLTTLIIQQLGHRLGLLNSLVYPNEAAFHDIIKGSNGKYKAGPGYDAVTGLGSPDGQAVLKAMGSASTGSSRSASGK
jgi:kumamolisin